MPRDEESSLPPVLIAFVVIVLAVVGGGFLLQTRMQAMQAAMAEREAYEAAIKVRSVETEKEEKSIQGRWLAEKEVSSGVERGMNEETALVIDGESISWTYTKKKGNAAKSSTTNFTYKLDPSKKPPEIDLSPTEGDFKGKVFPSIYELDGDTLTLCRNQPGQKRPNEFVSNKGSDEVLVILKRVLEKP